MKKIHDLLRNTILSIIDFFYPPFNRFFSPQVFRYLACGGANTSLDIILFFVSYNFIFDKQNLELDFVTLSPHIASFLLAFSVTFPIGFYLSRYVVFKHSEVGGRTQLTRYFLVVLCCIFFNYIFLKFFVEYLCWYPTIAKIVTTLLVVGFSYVSQTYFSFNSKKTVPIA